MGPEPGWALVWRVEEMFVEGTGLPVGLGLRAQSASGSAACWEWGGLWVIPQKGSPGRGH